MCDLGKRARRGTCSDTDEGAAKRLLGLLRHPLPSPGPYGNSQLARTSAPQGSGKPKLELCGISDDPRIVGLVSHRFDVRRHPPQAHYWPAAGFVDRQLS
jgi:hypothetical protein